MPQLHTKDRDASTILDRPFEIGERHVEGTPRDAPPTVFDDLRVAGFAYGPQPLLGHFTPTGAALGIETPASVRDRVTGRVVKSLKEGFA
jgi:hypothetical protein